MRKKFIGMAALGLALSMGIAGVASATHLPYDDYIINHDTIPTFYPPEVPTVACFYQVSVETGNGPVLTLVRIFLPPPCPLFENAGNVG